ncbi:MAG TPA: substrate-binding domain-containing protein [Terriglobia bacterium]|jgi:molybdate transport system substrate-binding protein
MKTRWLGPALLSLTIVMGAAQLRAAQGEPVRVLASNGVKAAVDELSPAAQSSIGHTLALQYGTTVLNKQKIEAGENFDATILTSEAIDALIKEGKLAARSRTDMGRVGIGVGIRAGAKKPDIGTPDGIKQTLLNAKAVTYASDGASRVHIEKMFEALGITDKMKPKLVLVQGSDASLNAVKGGKAEIILTLISEIMPDKGVELVGPLPDKFQSYVSFAAGVNAGAKNPDAANALIKFLSAPKAASTFKAKGIQTGK